MSTYHPKTLANLALPIEEGLPTSDSSPSEVASFIDRARGAARGKLKIGLQSFPGGEGPTPADREKLVPYGGKTHLKDQDRRLAKLKKGQAASFAGKLGKRLAALLQKKGIDPATATPGQITKRLKTARGNTASNSKPKSAVKGKPEHLGRIELKSFNNQRKARPGGHGGGAIGAGGGATQKGYGDSFGRPSEPHEEQMGTYVAKTIIAGGLTESTLMERRGRDYSAKKDHKTRRQRFKDKRAAGSLKGHKVTKSDSGKSKYENPTTFKKCPRGAMVSTPHLRHEMPKNKFVKAGGGFDGKTPTFPVRSRCRASLGGVARALQFAKPNKSVTRQVLSRINRLGGTRGKARFRAWGTGVGGSRMETRRGPSGAPKRAKGYGTSTGERDNRLHTASHEHGKAGNREVARAGKAAYEKGPEATKSKGSMKRADASERTTIERSRKKTQDERRGPVELKERGKKMRGEGASLADKFASKRKSKRKGKKKKGRR